MRVEKVQQKIKILLWGFYFLFLAIPISYAACIIYNNDESVTHPKSDALISLFTTQESCPQNVQQFQRALKQAGLTSESAMVAKRGFHNPKLGSFNFVGIVSGKIKKLARDIPKGEFFFTHTTVLKYQTVTLNQAPAFNHNVMQVIVWDDKKQYFNFYELINLGSRAQWFYRGNSLDALQDNQYVQRNVPNKATKFGTQMNCSACHNSGGPIMKELKAPHNDWWTLKRPLPLGFNQQSPELMEQMKTLVEPRILSNAVIAGIEKLEASKECREFKANQSLQEQLRPLFCEMEINLESDIKANHELQEIKIPAAFFMPPLYEEKDFLLSRSNYQNLIVLYRMRFPETNEQDADHAWLMPVKGLTDILAIKSLIANGIIDQKFAAAVLSVDRTHIIFSKTRCELLKLVPNQKSHKWQSDFLTALRTSRLPEAQYLYKQLSNPMISFEMYQRQMDQQVFEIKQSLNNSLAQRAYFQQLIDLRRAVLMSEISQNPQGQILEVGERVIFPEG